MMSIAHGFCVTILAATSSTVAPLAAASAKDIASG